MPTSLFAGDFQSILEQARDRGSGTLALTPSPEDWRDQWIYFLMVDRFNNRLRAPKAQFDDPNFVDFQGGTYRGIQEELPYLKELGAGAIWLSPVLRNLKFEKGTYHGYGIHDFLRAEPRFAENPDHADDELKELVDAAHRQGLFVIFDIVLNHVGNFFSMTVARSPASMTPLRMYAGVVPTEPRKMARRRSRTFRTHRAMPSFGPRKSSATSFSGGKEDPAEATTPWATSPRSNRCGQTLKICNGS